jgi:hypothetical protein
MRFRLSGKIFPWKKISAVGRFLFLQDQKFQGQSVLLGTSAGVPGSKVSDELTAVRRHVKKEEGHGGAPVIEVLRDASPFECLYLRKLTTRQGIVSPTRSCGGRDLATFSVLD